MSLFCLLWTPLFYLFRRSIFSSQEAGSGGIWALLLGSLVALLHFFLGALINPGGFGLSRWLSGCVDIVVLPALLPLPVYFVLTRFRMVSGKADFTNFALLWLIPGGALRAVSWSAQRDPILLVLVPLLWTALAAGIPFCAGLIFRRRPRFPLPLPVLAALGLPFLAATVYWAFFYQKLVLGYSLLIITVIPAGLCCIPEKKDPLDFP
ncbi:MAG: hypothetical protein LBT87_04020 [Treponema sp.]|jgi:hypothetical protein|nr:hypothetical protein [Treponema sp.]